MTRIAFMIATAATLSLSAALAATPVKQTLPAPAASTAAPTIITKVTPELMLAIVKGAGFTATLDKTGDSPELTLTRKNSDVVIYLNLHDCKTGSCSEADAYVYYSADDLDTAPDDSDMAAWNMENYTQAYIDSEDDDSVNLDSLYYFKGGFTKANFVYWLNQFKIDADAFDEMLQEL